ncbi:MAG: DUF4350 domain-containing protein [Chloroflexi bacterium]|nr:DUF4350 domain-containing protein [Chloroflexota bacterium]
MRLSRDGWLGLGLAFLLILVMTAAAMQQQNAEATPYLSTSPAPNGMLALRLWLGRLNYQVRQDTVESFEPPAGTDILLMIQPLAEVTFGEFKTLDAWVENGGTLIVAGDSLPARTLFFYYEFNREFLPTASPPLAAQTPLLMSPPQVDPARFDALYGLTSDRNDYVTHIAHEGHPIIVSFEQGRGRVILSTTAYPFSNLGIQEAGNAELVLNLVSLAVERDAVWFDEWHHGIQRSVIVGPEEWLRRTPMGHALLFILLAIFLALVLQGRGFGRPIPLLREIKRRGPLEHVTAVANLNRKAGHRAAVLAHYHRQLKRHLGKRYRLDPALPDVEYARMLYSYNPAINEHELFYLLTRLSQKNVSDGELVKLADEAAKWMTER